MPDIRPRIAPVAEPNTEQREALEKTRHAPDGQPLNLFATLAHRPKLMRRVNALGGYFMLHGEIPVRQREIVVLRTASHVGSDYEIGQHRWIAAEAGLTAAEIEAAIDPTGDHPWTPQESALLRVADELATTDTVSDDAWDGLGWLAEGQRLDLLVMVGFYRMVGGLLNGVGIELDTAVVEKVAG